MGVYQDERVRSIEIEIPRDPSRGLGMIVRDEYRQLLPGMGGRNSNPNSNKQFNEPAQVSVSYRASRAAKFR